MKRTVLFFILASCLLFGGIAVSLFAEDADNSFGSEIVTDEDALFGDYDDTDVASGDAGIESVNVSSSEAGVTAFLQTDSVRVGGTVDPGLQASWIYFDPAHSFSLIDPDLQALTPSIPALLFVDARPKEDFRVYGSVKMDWPFVNTTTSYLNPDNTITTLTQKNVRVFELFSDFNWNDRVFFRFGKHSVKWGVGYFFSPADVISLTKIDMDDPEAQREGPVSLRANIPIPGRQDNIWAYVLVPDTDIPATLKPEDIGGAAKYELVLGGWEFAFGGVYQHDNDPRLMLTASGSLGQLGLFGEAVTSFTGLSDDTDNSAVHFSGTAGCMYTQKDWNFTATGQYYYNGEAELDTRTQYAALYLSKSKLFIDDLSVALLTMANVSDLSFVVKPSVTWGLLDYASLSFTPSFLFSTNALWGLGNSGEYVSVTGAPALTLSVKVSLGSGRF